MFSPDGRWLAYMSMSNESGSIDVFVTPFPGPGPKWQVSTGGGGSLNPAWSPTRHELFYGFNGQIMVAAFSADSGSFHVEKPRLWAEGRYEMRGAPSRMFDLHPDGERFALASTSHTPIGAPLDKVVFIFNFFDELRRIAPATK